MACIIFILDSTVGDHMYFQITNLKIKFMGGGKNLKDERKTTNNSVSEKLFEVLILILFIS